MDGNDIRNPQLTSRQARPRRTRFRPVDAAFNLWLERGLHQLYDHVALEPLPEELLKLIQESGVDRLPTLTP